MKRLNTAVDDIRLDRKHFSISGSLLPFLLLSVLLVTQTSARSLTENEKLATTTISKTQISNERAAQQQKNDTLYNDENNSADLTFDDGDEYADVDNVEWHHVKIVDGIMHEDHPIIMYKEDFVSEDYDPNKHNSNNEQTNQQRRKYKNIKRQKRLNRTDEQTANTSEKYHALKPEKIYFDILPQSPVVLTDDSNSNDSKFDPSRIRVEVISLLDDEKNSSKMPEDDDELSKQLLNKHPKKYHHRHHQHQRKRRDATAIKTSAHDEENVHIIKKRNPHYIYSSPGVNSFDIYNKHLINWPQNKHPVAGNHWNGIDGDVPDPPPLFDSRFGGESNTDRVVWGKATKKTKPTAKPATRPTQRPSTIPTEESIFHNSNPEDADFSIFNKNNNNNNANRHPPTNNRIPNNNNFNNRRPSNQRPNDFMRPTFAPPPDRPATSAPPVSKGQCVYAILQCCSTNDSKIRYECFDRFGCSGAFWNLNPCADRVKDAVTDYFDQKYNKDDYDY